MFAGCDKTGTKNASSYAGRVHMQADRPAFFGKTLPDIMHTNRTCPKTVQMEIAMENLS